MQHTLNLLIEPANFRLVMRDSWVQNEASRPGCLRKLYRFTGIECFTEIRNEHRNNNENIFTLAVSITWITVVCAHKYKPTYYLSVHLTITYCLIPRRIGNFEARGWTNNGDSNLQTHSGKFTPLATSERFTQYIFLNCSVRFELGEFNLIWLPIKAGSQRQKLKKTGIPVILLDQGRRGIRISWQYFPFEPNVLLFPATEMYGV